MVDSISNSRWSQAQEFELKEWQTNQDQVIQNEWNELLNKLQYKFPEIASKINLSKNDYVLDVGCGPTVASRLLLSGKITGIEPLADKLGISGKDKVAKGIEIIAAQAEAMPFDNQCFKLVVCRNVIDHTQNPNKIINEIYRVTRTDGYLLLICYVYAPFITFIKNLSERIGLFNNVGHPHTYTDNSLEKLIDSRFSIIERYTFHTGQHSTDYGKLDITPDKSIVNKVIIWLNKHLFKSKWFLKEYGYLARKITIEN